jgi:exonuclease SbcD
VRLIHTSDWHLGQTFHGFERTYEHVCFLKWLIDTLASENADVLLVSGDIFENPNPSAEARRTLYRFISEVRGRLPHLQMVFIAGNHDSPARIEEPVPLLEVFRARAIGPNPT